MTVVAKIPCQPSVVLMCSNPSVFKFPPINPTLFLDIAPPTPKSRTNLNNRKGRRKRTLRTEELARDVEGFTSHDDDLLAHKQLLRNSAGQATKEVSLAVDDDL